MNNTQPPTTPQGSFRLHTLDIEGYSFDLVLANSGYLLKPRGKATIPFRVTLLGNPNFPSMKNAKQQQLQKLSELIEVAYIAQIKKSGNDYEVTYQLKSLSQIKNVVTPKKSGDKRDSKVNQLISSYECKTPPALTTSSKLKGTNSPKEMSIVTPFNLSCTSDESIERHSLKSDINEFLSSDKKVLLLVADPGSCLTSFCKDLQGHLKKESRYSGRYIHHIQIEDDFKEENSEIITMFIKKEHELNDSERLVTLRNNNSFVFICEGVEKLGINFFERNSLSKWTAHTIFVCNSLSISSDIASNLKMFAPLKSDRTGAKSDQFQRAYLSPLDEQEITTLWKDYPKHKAKIESLGLKPLLSNPLFLTIISEIVPKAVSPGKSPSNIFAQVVDEWFVRQRDRKLEAKNLCIKLAKAMKDADVMEYEPPEPDDAEEPPFEEFFGQKNRHLLSISPIKKEGNKFSFLDPSLKKFFASL